MYESVTIISVGVLHVHTGSLNVSHFQGNRRVWTNHESSIVHFECELTEHLLFSCHILFCCCCFVLQFALLLYSSSTTCIQDCSAWKLWTFHKVLWSSYTAQYFAHNLKPLTISCCVRQKLYFHFCTSLNLSESIAIHSTLDRIVIRSLVVKQSLGSSVNRQHVYNDIKLHKTKVGKGAWSKSDKSSLLANILGWFICFHFWWQSDVLCTNKQKSCVE